uniref:cytochrome b n=1 Tax=Ciconiphilus decimfasciatus TaxID=2212705 RepID=UPI00257993AA|nr:cytochrome b [Ciconiphilus decimfasciatus]WGW14991.1 cytochrome b [Ciconiphilus decimfasciatus]
MNLVKLPCPTSISMMWNFGSLLGLVLMIQIISGFFLSMHYFSSVSLAYESVVYINQNVNWGWLLRYIHANGASFFFLFIYVHIGRGLFYKSYNLIKVWYSGIMMYVLFMMVAFMGYVLPWGQMSYWGATVITNLISAIPYLGAIVMEWVWGGFSVSEPTLSRFFSLHFILPLFGLTLVLVHLFFLHETGSNNPLGLDMNSDKISFHPLFTIKDLLGILFFFLFFSYVCLQYPFLFMDPDNFIKANSLITPVHIQPEWYFLFAYSILRSVPNKLGGVIMMIMSIMIMLILPLMKKSNNMQMSKFYNILCVLFFFVFIFLTWIGSLPVESPYLFLGQVFSVMYFMILIMLCMF